MEISQAIAVARDKGVFSPMVSEPFGKERHDPAMPYVKERDFMYDIRECDVCGRKFAVLKESIFRNCSDLCTAIWRRMTKYRTNRMRLFYYHTKLRRALGTDIPNGPQFVKLTPSANAVFEFIKNNGWSSILDIVAGTGMKKSTVATALTHDLLESNLLWSKSEIINGKAVKKWNIEEHVIYKKKGCPICLQHYFKVNRTRNEMMCLACRAQWRITDDGNFA